MSFIICNNHKDCSIFKFGTQINVFEILVKKNTFSEKNYNIINE